MTAAVKTTISSGTAVGEGEGATAVKVVSSLSKKMAEPGGLTVAAIERRSYERLLSHKHEAMQSVERAVSEMEARTAGDMAVADNELYRITSQMLDLAGFFDTGPLYEAGYSLCELLDVMKGKQGWSPEAIRVHVRALRLILKDHCQPTSHSAALLEGLRAVLEHARKA